MVSRFHPRHNSTLNINSPAANARITTHASRWLWTVFGLMLFSCVVAFGWWYSKPKHKWEHLPPPAVLSVASLAYLVMALDWGWAPVPSESDGHPMRQVFYARYIMYFFNAPSILGSILSFASLPKPRMVLIPLLSCVLVICGLSGAMVPSSSKWALYAFGLVFLIIVWYMMLGYVRRFEFPNQDYRTCYFRLAMPILLLWVLYSIGWALCEGTNIIPPTGETIFYGILDLLSGPFFLLVYAIYLDKVDAPAQEQEPQQQEPQQQPVPAAQKATQPETRNHLSSPVQEPPSDQPLPSEVQNEGRRVESQPEGSGSRGSEAERRHRRESIELQDLGVSASDLSH